LTAQHPIDSRAVLGSARKREFFVFPGKCDIFQHNPGVFLNLDKEKNVFKKARKKVWGKMRAKKNF
jgi:hypothetical protein